MIAAEVELRVRLRLRGPEAVNSEDQSSRGSWSTTVILLQQRGYFRDS